MSKVVPFFLALILVSPVLAGGRIQTLQKRIKKDRKDILCCMTRIRDAQERMKKDRARARSAGETGPDDKWTARAAQEAARIDKDRQTQAKAQKDLGEAQAELDRLLSR